MYGRKCCDRVRAWSAGTHCSRRLRVMTLAELIHIIKHSVLHLYLQHLLSGGVIMAFTICHLSPLARPQLHIIVCVIGGDLSSVCVC